MARIDVPVGPPTSPSKPGSKGRMTNTLNVAPCLYIKKLNYFILFCAKLTCVPSVCVYIKFPVFDCV